MHSSNKQIQKICIFHREEKNGETSCNEFSVKNYIKKSILCVKQRWSVRMGYLLFREETNVEIIKQKSEMDEKFVQSML